MSFVREMAEYEETKDYVGDLSRRWFVLRGEGESRNLEESYPVYRRNSFDTSNSGSHLVIYHVSKMVETVSLSFDWSPSERVTDCEHHNKLYSFSISEIR